MYIDHLLKIGLVPYDYLISNKRSEPCAERFSKTTAAIAFFVPGILVACGCFLAKKSLSCCFPKPKKIQRKAPFPPMVVRKSVPFPPPKNPVFSPNVVKIPANPQPVFNPPAKKEEVLLAPEIDHVVLKKEFSLLRDGIDSFISCQKKMELFLQNLEKLPIYAGLQDELDKQLILIENALNNNQKYDEKNLSKIVNYFVEVSTATDRFLSNYEAKAMLVYQRSIQDRHKFLEAHSAFCGAAIGFWSQAKKLSDLAHHQQASRLAEAKLLSWHFLKVKKNLINP